MEKRFVFPAPEQVKGGAGVTFDPSIPEMDDMPDYPPPPPMEEELSGRSGGFKGKLQSPPKRGSKKKTPAPDADKFPSRSQVNGEKKRHPSGNPSDLNGTYERQRNASGNNVRMKHESGGQTIDQNGKIENGKVEKPRMPSDGSSPRRGGGAKPLLGPKQYVFNDYSASLNMVCLCGLVYSTIFESVSIIMMVRVNILNFFTVEQVFSLI